MRLGVLASHPIQYQAPLFRSLAKKIDTHVYFSHKVTPKDHAKTGFGVEFEWDIELCDGYPHTFLCNRATRPSVDHFFGCDTPEIVKKINRGKFDAFIVMGWNLKSYWQAIRVCHDASIPILVRGDSQIGTPRPLITKVLKSVFYKPIVRQFKGYLIVGERAKEYLLRYGADPRRMFFSPHCVDNERFERDSRMSQDQKLALRKRLGIQKEENVIIFVGKFIQKKRPLDLVKALSILRQKGIPVCGLFVGSGPLEREIVKLANKTVTKISLVGFVNQSDLPRHYGISDLLVLPSDGAETWGLVVNEAMACGVPAVISDQVGCGPDLIDIGKTGTVFPVGNVSLLAGGIREMLEVFSKEDVKAAIRKKMNVYSISTAVKGIAEAVCSLTN